MTGAIDGDPKSGWGIWKKDFDYNQPRKAVFRLKETWPAGEGTRFTLRLRHKHDAKKHLLGRFRVSVTAAPEPSIEIRDGLPGEIVHILSTPPAKRLAKQRDSLARHHRSLMPDFIAARRGGETTRAAIKKLNDSLGSTMVMRDSAKPRDTFLLVRGVYDQPDKSQSIQPGVPASLPGLAKRGRANRLDLARWLTDPNHPLTARVTVNRYWQHFFGIGLVKTTEDFGVQGERPEHPRLLDWLATEFVQSGWNVKHLHRLIVTSAAYRQASAVTPELLERDPQNRLHRPRPAPSHERANHPRPGARARRVAGGANGRPAGQAVPAARCLVRLQFRENRLQALRRRVALPAQPLHVLAALGEAGDVFRQPGAARLHRAPQPHEHPDARAQPAQRHHLRRGRPLLRRATAAATGQ